MDQVREQGVQGDGLDREQRFGMVQVELDPISWTV
jgi:hypothetical protein